MLFNFSTTQFLMNCNKKEKTSLFPLKLCSLVIHFTLSIFSQRNIQTCLTLKKRNLATFHNMLIKLVTFDKQLKGQALSHINNSKKQSHLL